MPQSLSLLRIFDGNDADEQVGVPAKVLGARMHDTVCSLLEGILQGRWCKSGINCQLTAGPMRERGVVGYITRLTAGIERRF